MTSAAAQVAQALAVGSLSLPPNEGGTGRMTHTGCSPIRKKATRACLVFSVLDMAHYVTESPFFVFGVFTVFVFGIYFSNFFESSILRIWCV